MIWLIYFFQKYVEIIYLPAEYVAPDDDLLPVLRLCVEVGPEEVLRSRLQPVEEDEGGAIVGHGEGAVVLDDHALGPKGGVRVPAAWRKGRMGN